VAAATTVYGIGPDAGNAARDFKTQFAAGLMSKARQEVAERRKEEEPEIPVMPFVQGVYRFPLYWSVAPAWIALSVGLIVNLFLVQTVNELMASGGPSMVMSAFVAAFGGITSIGLVGIFVPRLMAILEQTAAVRDTMDYWPSVDFFERFYSALLLFNALAISSLPGVLIAWNLGRFGVPKWFGLASALVLFPPFLLSMIDSGSLWNVGSPRIRHSISSLSGSWTMFWVSSILLVVGTGLLCITAWSMDATVGIMVTSFCASAAAIIYFRLLGRLAWLIADADAQRSSPDEHDDESD
jgi:hypothetical protein